MGSNRREFWKKAKEGIQKISARFSFNRNTSKEFQPVDDFKPTTENQNVIYFGKDSDSENTDTLELDSGPVYLRENAPLIFDDGHLRAATEKQFGGLSDESLDVVLTEIDYHAIDQPNRLLLNSPQFQHDAPCESLVVAGCTGDHAFSVTANPDVEPTLGRATSVQHAFQVASQNLVDQLTITTALQIPENCMGDADASKQAQESRLQQQQQQSLASDFPLLPSRGSSGLWENGQLRAPQIATHNSAATHAKRVCFKPEDLEHEEPIGWVMVPMPVYDESLEFMKDGINACVCAD